jgi:small-conductance mechanosensitive channel
MNENAIQTMQHYILLSSPLSSWFYAAATAALFFLGTRIAKAVLLKRFKEPATGSTEAWYGIVARIIGRIHTLFLLAAAIYLGALFLSVPVTTARIFKNVFIVILSVQTGLMASQAIKSGIEQYRRRQIPKNAEVVTMLSAVSFLLRILLWTLLLLVVLATFGVDITALVAGLGVGGVAVALAVQNILGDIFASFSIVLDKPFVIGDFIIVNDLMGTVEYVGLKTTRIRSLSGEQLVFSNHDLLNSRIRNYKRMYERRVVFGIGVLYQTPVEKIEMIPGIIKQIVEAQHPVRFDRAHFKEFGAYALNFEIVYWVLDPDYNVYMDIQQAINIALYRSFTREGIEFAYPTQTVVLQNGDNP